MTRLEKLTQQKGNDRIEQMKSLALFMEFIAVDKRKRIDQIFYTKAPFLGEAVLDYDYSHEPTAVRETEFRCSKMLFDSSWEWLMPVVEKIELMGYEVIMRKDTCEIIGDNYEETMDFDAGRHITTFSAVVEFIKWYNENK